MSRSTKASLRERSGHGTAGKLSRKMSQMVRRMRVESTKRVLWVLAGFVDGEDNVEPENAESFDGVGFAARPHADNDVEAIVLKVGSQSGHPVIVATRDHDGRRSLEMLEEMLEDETATYNSQTLVKHTADGFVDVGSIGGTKGELATKSDIDELKSIFDAWVTAPNDGGASLKAALADWNPKGTQKLRGE